MNVLLKGNKHVAIDFVNLSKMNMHIKKNCLLTKNHIDMSPKLIEYSKIHELADINSGRLRKKLHTNSQIFQSG